MLQAQFALIDGKIAKADRLFSQALVTADEKDLTWHKTEIIKGQTALKSQLGKWKEMVTLNTPLLERIEQTELESYFEELRKMQNL